MDGKDMSQKLRQYNIQNVEGWWVDTGNEKSFRVALLLCPFPISTMLFFAHLSYKLTGYMVAFGPRITWGPN